MARGRQVQYPLQPPGGLLPWLTPTQRWPRLGIVGRKGLCLSLQLLAQSPHTATQFPTPGTYPSSSLDDEKGERGEGGVKGKGQSRALEDLGRWREGRRRSQARVVGGHRDPREYGAVRQSPLGALAKL